MGKNNGRHDRGHHSESSDAHLRQLQDLLLAGERRAFKDRLTQVERALARQLKETQAELRRELKAFEKRITRQIEQLGGEFEAEVEAREAGEAALKLRLERAQRSLRARDDKHREESRQRDATLRKRVTALSRKVREDSPRQVQKLVDEVRGELETLAARCASKEDLASLFASIAESLDGDAQR